MKSGQRGIDQRLYVRLGSKSDFDGANSDVCFIPESGHPIRAFMSTRPSINCRALSIPDAETPLPVGRVVLARWRL